MRWEWDWESLKKSLGVSKIVIILVNFRFYNIQIFTRKRDMEGRLLSSFDSVKIESVWTPLIRDWRWQSMIGERRKPVWCPWMMHCPPGEPPSLIQIWIKLYTSLNLPHPPFEMSKYIYLGLLSLERSLLSWRGGGCYSPNMVYSGVPLKWVTFLEEIR